jgi:hypothetical protein
LKRHPLRIGSLTTRLRLPIVYKPDGVIIEKLVILRFLVNRLELSKSKVEFLAVGFPSDVTSQIFA